MINYGRIIVFSIVSEITSFYENIKDFLLYRKYHFLWKYQRFSIETLVQWCPMSCFINVYQLWTTVTIFTSSCVLSVYIIISSISIHTWMQVKHYCAIVPDQDSVCQVPVEHVKTEFEWYARWGCWSTIRSRFHMFWDRENICCFSIEYLCAI